MGFVQNERAASLNEETSGVGKANAKWLVLANVAVGTFMATLDGSIVNLALPTMAKDFGVGMDQIQWVVSGYMLTISSFLLFFGRLGDVLGKGKVYNYGFLGFIFGSLLCGLAGSTGQLVGARVIQAVGASVLMACGMGIVTQAFPPQERGKALGTMGSVVAMGSLAGPGLGGLIVGQFGWPAIFLINIPIGLSGFLLGLRVLPKDKQEQRERVDVFGAVMLAGAIVSVIMGLNLVRDQGWLGTPVLILAVAAVVLLAVFIHRQFTIPSPLVDLSLFKNIVFTSGLIASGLCFVAMFFSNILMPFYLTEILRLEPQQLGIIMMSFPVMMAVTSPLSGWLSDRIGARPMAITGLGVMMLALFLLSRLDESATMTDVFIRMSFTGIANGLFQSPNNSSVMGSVHKRFLGIAGSVVSVVRNVGMVLGISLSVTLFSQIKAGALATGVGSQAAFLTAYSQVLMVAVGITFASLILSAVRPTKLIKA